MSKEDDLKSINLKVSVNCCEGCKRRVSKALSIKGVLKTEIHPTLPKITVIGYVDAHTLIAKLAKRGKKAELWPDQPKHEKDVRVPKHVDNNEKDFEDDKRNVPISHNADTIDNKVDRNSEASIPNDNGSAKPTASRESAIDHQVNCLENPNTGPPIQSRVYYGMSNPYVVPVIYYTANADTDVDDNFSVTPPSCLRQQHRYELPVHHQLAPVDQQMDFADYFNDENTVGCCVM